ncbi:MAG: SseB family protein [Rhodobacteraceae bacterium]|nr:SseB family protein [Paracoccaceae bacterium]
MDTSLDLAYVAMQKDEAQAPAFYARFLETELFLLLETEIAGDEAKPMVMETSDGPLVLVFDLEARMAAFSEVPSDYVALSGRRIARMLAGQEVSIGLNLGESPSAMVMPIDAVSWLAGAAIGEDEAIEAKPVEINKPTGVPEALIVALDGKLANMGGVVGAAHLVSVRYKGGEQGHMLALVNVPEAAKPGVSEALSEAVRFSGIEAGQLDLAFLEADDPHLASFARAGLAFEIPELILPKKLAPLAPGMDPDKPPILR